MVGTIDFNQSSSSGKYIDAKIEWSSSADIGANNSDVTASLYVRKGDTTQKLTIPTEGSWPYSLTINSTSYTGSAKLSVLEDWVLVTTKTVSDIAHNNDGSKSITISGSVTAPSVSSFKGHTSSGSTAVTLDSIPRASTIDYVADSTLGENCAVRWTPKSASFRYKLQFSVGGWNYATAVIHPNTTAAYTYTGYVLPIEMANHITTKTGRVTVILRTYSDSGANTQVGTDTKTFTVTVPENGTRPTVSSMSVAPVSSLKAPFNSLYIQGHSKVKATLSFETRYNATVVASNITVGGSVYEAPYESDTLNQTGKLSIKATVKDSRGHYGTNYKEIEVIPYSKPYVRAKSGESEIIAARCDASANFTDSGTYLKIKAKIVYEKVISNGVQNNFGKIKFRYRIEGGSYSAWQTIHDTKTTNSDEVITAPLLSGALNVKSNYQVQIIASDDLYDSEPVTIAIPSDSVYMDRPAGGTSMALGGYSTGSNILDVYWRTKARGGVSVFDATGNEIPLDSTMPIPRDQLKGSWNANSLANGVYIVTDSAALIVNGNTIMSNGVFIQMSGNVGGSVKFQLALPVDTNRSPMYRIQWYSNWSDWRSLKL